MTPVFGSSARYSSKSLASVVAWLPLLTNFSMPTPRRSAVMSSCVPMLPDWEMTLSGPGADAA